VVASDKETKLHIPGGLRKLDGASFAWHQRSISNAEDQAGLLATSEKAANEGLGRSNVQRWLAFSPWWRIATKSNYPLSRPPPCPTKSQPLCRPVPCTIWITSHGIPRMLLLLSWSYFCTDLPLCDYGSSPCFIRCWRSFPIACKFSLPACLMWIRLSSPRVGARVFLKATRPHSHTAIQPKDESEGHLGGISRQHWEIFFSALALRDIRRALSCGVF